MSGAPEQPFFQCGADPPPPPLLTVRSGYARIRVRVSEIRWIEGAGDYVRLHLPDTAHLLSETLKQLERRLDDGSTVRVARTRRARFAEALDAYEVPPPESDPVG